MLSIKEMGNTAKQNSKNIFFAGLGIYATAEENMKTVFNKLVEKGSKMENKSEGAIQEKAGAVRENAQKIVAKLEDGIANSMRGVLNRIGVPSREEIQNLSKNVRELTLKVEKLQPQA